MKHDSDRMMAYGIATAATRFIRLIRGDAAQAASGRGKPRAVLVLQVQNGEMLRASLGSARVEGMMQVIASRLTNELRFSPDGQAAGQLELFGPLTDGSLASLPGRLAQLGAICRSGIDLGDLRVTPVINAVIVSDESATGDPGALYRYGRDAIAACSPLADAGQIRFVEYPTHEVQPVSRAEPLFSADMIDCFYQPQICCDTGALVALRVVSGVDHPEMGRLAFEDFQSRLDPDALAASFRAVLRQGLSALREWDRAGYDVPFLSLPVSDRDLADPTLVDTVLWELDRLDLAPQRLELELSEPVGRFGGRVPVTNSLRRLTDTGCRMAMGGFGSGNTGLDDLRSFGISRVRIDHSFVAGCDHRANQQRMILAILALAEHLNLNTLGDGVVTLEERSFLSQIGFNAVQGKAVVEPLSRSDTGDFLRGHAQTLPPLFSITRRA